MSQFQWEQNSRNAAISIAEKIELSKNDSKSKYFVGLVQLFRIKINC